MKDNPIIHITNDLSQPSPLASIRIRHSKGAIEYDMISVADHCRDVAIKAKASGEKIGLGEWCEFAAMLHDLGKNTPDFQNYLLSQYGLAHAAYGDKTHAWIGAVAAQKIYNISFPIIPLCIAGHHAGIPDYDNAVFSKQMPESVKLPQINKPDMPPLLSKMKNNASEFCHVVRMVESALVDADRLCSEEFNDQAKSAKRKCAIIKELKPRLDAYLRDLNGKSDNSLINEARRELQNTCVNVSALPKGTYSLTAPTGLGKTIAAVAWALNHAIAHGMDRIIFAIPYISITTQTAEVMREIFGDENVLEHHSNSSDIIKANDATAKSLASENWDYLIIVTTNVQVLESMMSNHPSKLRKLHNISNSVLIFDEIQALPTKRLDPILHALKTYVRLFGCSILLTTASQPQLCGVIHGRGHDAILNGFESVVEITSMLPEHVNLSQWNSRVDAEIIDGSLDYQQIADKLMGHDQVLCIVNTRFDAYEIYKLLCQQDLNALHLSRMMCSSHIKSTINSIKQMLSDHKPLRVISTQLVEAGVDIDFPVVFRQEAGLDSLLQSAGRCNREGKLDKGKFFVFKIKGRNVPAGTLRDANEARKLMGQKELSFDSASVNLYFKLFYQQCLTFDEKIEGYSVADYQSNPMKLRLKSASDIFRLIDDNTIPILINYGIGDRIANKMRAGDDSKKLLRLANSYSVQIRQGDVVKLKDSGLIEELQNGILYCPYDAQYDPKAGLLLESHFINEPLII